MSRPVATRELAELMVCHHCGESHGTLELQSVCHPGAPTRTWYEHGAHRLIVRCAVCAREVLTVQLPSGEVN